MNGLKISVNADNITEILGYYHHELSQHTNDISTLKLHIQTLIEEKQKSGFTNTTLKSNSEQSFSIFIENCNARLEAFAASIKSLSKQMTLLDESSQKLKNYFDTTICSFQTHIDEIEKSIKTVATSTETNVFSPHSPKNKKKECKTKSSIKKRKLSSFGQREKSDFMGSLNKGDANEENEIQNNFDNLEPDNSDEILKKYESITEDISILKNSINEIVNNSKNDRNSIRTMISNVSGQLENFVTHKELEAAISVQLEKSRQTPTALVCTSNGQKRSIQTPRRKVHVTLINGEVLSSEHRQTQTQQIRYSASIGQNYGNSQSNYTNHSYAPSGNNRTILSSTQGGAYFAPIQCH